MIQVNCLIMASEILCNLMIKEPFPEEWMHVDDDADEEEESDELDMARQELNEAPDNTMIDERSRALHNCMCFKF